MPSRGSSAEEETASGETTPVDPPSPPQELHEVLLPPPMLPELPELPGIAEFNKRTEALCLCVEEHNQQIRARPPAVRAHLAALLAHIWSGENLDKVAFPEGNITYRQLRWIDQSSNPHLYTEASTLADADYQPPRYQDKNSQGEEEEEEEAEEEHPLQIPDPSGTHLRILHSEYNSEESSSERLRESLE